MHATLRSLLNRRRLTLALGAAATLGLLTLGSHLQAEECPTFRPGPEHEILAAFRGTYELAFSDGAKGGSTCQSGLGGQWLLEEVRADFCGKPYEGRGATSYDPARKKYVNVWIDSVSPVPFVSEGTYDAATRTLTFAGEMTLPGGATTRATLTIVRTDADSRTFRLEVSGPSGAPTELFHITYRRRAD